MQITDRAILRAPFGKLRACFETGPYGPSSQTRRMAALPRSEPLDRLGTSSASVSKLVLSLSKGTRPFGHL